jgi:DNA polymerase I
MPSRVFLIDGSALVYRSHFAFIRNPLVTSTGLNVSAVFGFAQTLLMVLRDEKATHAAVAFDTPVPTERHERYAEYKAHRPPMPDPLVAQLPLIDELVRAVGIKNVTRPGFEADDLIASIAITLTLRGDEAVIVSADKDFHPILSDKIRQWVPPRGPQPAVWLGPKEVEGKWGVPPAQLVDVFALIGDAVDNVPGVPGIGEKTGLELIRDFGSLDSLYERLGDVARPSIREKLTKHRTEAFLSRELIRLQTNLVPEIEIDEYLVPDLRERADLLPLLQRLEFRRMVEQLGLKPPTVWDGRIELVRDTARLAEIASRFPGKGSFAIATEGTEGPPWRSRLLGVAFAWEPGSVTFAHVSAGAGDDGVPVSAIGEILGPILSNPQIEKVGRNLKCDLHRLARIGIAVRGPLFDLSIASYLIEPDRPRDPETLSIELLGHRKMARADLCGSGKQRVDVESLSAERLSEFAGEEADVALRLRDPLMSALRERNAEKLFRDIEAPLIPVLVSMERSGVCCDASQLASLSAEMEADLARLTKEIHRLAGAEFNIGSPQQVGEILFDRLRLRKRKKTKTGWSTDQDVLEDLAVDQPIARAILDHRQLQKLRSTYVDVLPRLADLETGRIHAQFNQTVAATGRLSSSDPNLQNIPIRTPQGRRIRRAFVAQNVGDLLLAADYSQIELRILAHLSGDEGLVEAFRLGADIHSATASRIFDIPMERVDSVIRGRAKVVNFGVLYGMGPVRLSREMGIPLVEARHFIQQYFQKMPRVRNYLEENLAIARRDGFVSTVLGRRRYLPELRSGDARVRAAAERVAANAPIQGSAADLIKVAMIEIQRIIIEERLESRLILQVHDELVMECPNDERERVAEIVRREMEGAASLKVPLKVDIRSGTNWDEAHA